MPSHRVGVLLIVHLDQYRGIVLPIDLGGDDPDMRNLHELGAMALGDHLGVMQIFLRPIFIRRLRPHVPRETHQQRNRQKTCRDFPNLHSSEV